MKVTYTQNRFEIDGVPVINPEVLFIEPVTENDRTFYAILDGDFFYLPDYVIAEKILTPEVSEWGVIPKEVYRLKLKEPLVDTGSKNNGDVAVYNHAIDDCKKLLYKNGRQVEGRMLDSLRK